MGNSGPSVLDKFVVPATVMLSFVSFWRAAAIVLSDLGSSAFYVGGIAEKAIGKACSLDKEQEFKSLFADCAIGAMPPLGNLYGLPTYVDRHLAEQDYIVFEAGTHTDAIKMSYRDYEKIVKPKVKDLAVKLQPMKGA